jgi:glucosylceramidase
MGLEFLIGNGPAAPGTRRHHGRATALLAAAVLGAALLGPQAATADPQPPVLHVTLTTADLTSALAPQPDISPGASTAHPDVTLDDSTSLQTIDGFGAAFTDSSDYLLEGLPAAERDRTMRTLFSRQDGIGLSFMREPMGASDYSATPPGHAAAYSYDDNGGAPDPGLAHFSIAHDERYVIPIVKQAQALNPAMKLYANTWSPPGWMKTTGSMIPVDGDAGTLTPAGYPALADYYVAFLRAYAAAGVHVWGVTPQNEPSVTPGGYPGMNLSAAQESKLVAQYLAPALRRAGLDTKVLGADDNPNVGYEESLLADPQVDQELYGLAYHCYGGNIGDIAKVAADHPKRSYLTECSPPPGIAPMTTSQLIIDSVNAGVSGVDTWNLALNPGGGPKMGAGCTNCDGLVTANPDGSVTYNLGFFQMGQFSRFVAPGATRLGVTAAGPSTISATGFRNPDGSEVLVASNNSGQQQTFTTAWNGSGSFAYTLPAGATVTFTTASQPTLGIPRDGATTVLYTHTGTGENRWDLEPAGAWGTSDGNAYSSQKGATATLAFRGSGVTLYAFPNSLNGMVSLAVDGGPAKLVDFSTEPGRTPRAMASFSGLDPDRTHTLVETVTGANGSADRGSYASLISAVTASDVVAPTVSLSAAEPPGSSGWYTGPVTVTPAAYDNADPAPDVETSVDGGAWKRTEGSVSVTADGVHTVAARAVDAAGNTSAVTKLTVRIDAAGPLVTTSVNPASPTGGGGWYTGPVTVTAAASDSVDQTPRIEFRLDGGAWTAYSSGIRISGDGTHALAFRAVDAAGAVSPAVERTVRIDATAPVSNAALAAAQRTVTLRAADSASGVAAVRYRLGDGPWQTAAGPVKLGRSGADLVYQAIDTAGNAEPANSLTVPAARS